MAWAMEKAMGSCEAVERVVREHAGWVFAAARRRVRDAALAEDVTQAVFLLYWQKRVGIAHSGKLVGWLYRAVRYCSANALRLNRIRERREREAAMERQQDGRSAGWSEVEAALEGAVDRLSEQDRQAVVLRFYRGLSLREVGEAVGIGEEAARKRVDRAVGRLRERLAASGVEAKTAGLGGLLFAHAGEDGVEGLVERIVAGTGTGSGAAGGIAKGAMKMMNAGAARLILGAAVLVLALALPVALAQLLESKNRTPAAMGLTSAATTPPSVDAPARGRYMDFLVVDSVTGQGIADVALTLRVAAEMQPQSLRMLAAKTDANGRYRIQLPSENPALLQVEAQKAALVPMGITWSAQELQGGMLSSYTLKMEKGTTVGGIVRDEQGQPIVGASVMLLVQGSGQGSDHPRALIRDHEVKTDAQGKWRCDVMPSKLEAVLVKLSHPAFQSDASYGESGHPNNDDLRKMTSVLTMRKGMQGAGIAGIVSDGETGKPIAGVTVRQGDDRWGTNHPETTTDAGGGFRFASAKTGKLTLTAQVAGYMPELQEIEVKPGMEPVRFQLRKGHGFAGVVVDVDGNPIPGAAVAADTWRGKRTIDWQGTTDANGQFFWDDAPADEVQYGIVKQGYLCNRDAKGTSGDEPTRFTLLPETKIHGKVVDAETGKPIEKFRVVTGSLWRKETRWFWNDRGSRTLTDGWYEATMNLPAEEYALRIEAEGYLAVVTQSVKAGTTDAVRDVKLRRGGGPKGVVLGVDGRPAEGATAGKGDMT